MDTPRRRLNALRERGSPLALAALAAAAVWFAPSAALSPASGLHPLHPVIELVGAPIAACDEPSCRPESPRLEGASLARAMSLDLRGTIPTVEEMAAFESGVSDATLDDWLASDEFQARVVRRHRDLLWNNVTNQRFVHFIQRLGTTSTAVGGTRRYYRSSGSRTDRATGDVYCDDRLDSLDSEGRARLVDGRDGYVMVRPYWAPDTEIAVCAIDAQTNRYSTSGRDCASRDSNADPGCGCGPNLMWCDVQSVQDTLAASFASEIEQRVAAHIAAVEPYSELFTNHRGFVNGPIVFHLRNQARWYNSTPLLPLSVDADSLPELDYTDVDTWVEVELPEAHSGVLTSTAYLLRFQTLRARASHFYDAFLCAPFTPPAGTLPVASEAEQRESDLQLRAGCRYCHAILEPAGAHWGRWMQQGAGFLAADAYPPFLQECSDCARGDEACSDTCRLNYLTRALSAQEEPYLGMLKVYEFLRPEHQANVEDGPAALVRDGLADGRFTSCTVSRTAQWLLGRALTDADAAYTDAYTQAFVAGGLEYEPLVRAIVTSELYGRAR